MLNATPIYGCTVNDSWPLLAVTWRSDAQVVLPGGLVVNSRDHARRAVTELVLRRGVCEPLHDADVLRGLIAGPLHLIERACQSECAGRVSSEAGVEGPVRGPTDARGRRTCLPVNLRGVQHSQTP